MRFLIALLALVALVAQPATASARAACVTDHPAAMAGMDHPGASMSMDAPCCDHAGKTGKMSNACAAACAGVCGVGVMMALANVGVAFVATPVDVAAGSGMALSSHHPTRLDPPPKSVV